MMTNAVTGDVPHVVRHSGAYLEIVGLRCGIQRPWQKQPCGGSLAVKDWDRQAVNGEMRYEIYCEKCHTCDPNGWTRQDEILSAARKHFHAPKNEIVAD